MHLIYHINKGLQIIPKEATDHVTLILTQEDHFNQGGEFMQSKCTSGRVPAGWNIGIEKAQVISTLHKIGEGGLKTHRSQI